MFWYIIVLGAPSQCDAGDVHLTALKKGGLRPSSPKTRVKTRAQVKMP